MRTNNFVFNMLSTYLSSEYLLRSIAYYSLLTGHVMYNTYPSIFNSASNQKFYLLLEVHKQHCNQTKMT